MDPVASLVDRLYGIFSPIYLKWHQWAPIELHLWQETSGKSKLEIVQQDIHAVGEYFAQADVIGARTEYTLTAECIAKLNLIAQDKPLTQAALEPEIDRICNMLDHGRMAERVKWEKEHSHPDDFIAPASWRIAEQVTAAGRCSPDAAMGLYNAYQEMATFFILRDGNVTPQEDAVWAGFYAAFKH